ncbi:uncharacterized protein LOC111903318 [Lactuca sativa]|uniref:uncharacterized protein LOC111903318 n=1 Tax=Lactuca sativa TaxID=4236 RepID=UPI000CD8B201|nr:uncharacterized protein LOC111903318 [Lactuca sativa]
MTSSSLPVGKPQASPKDGNHLPSSTAKSPAPSSTFDNPRCCSIEHDPGLHLPIWKYATNMKDEIRQAYIRSGPHQPVLPKYPPSRLMVKTSIDVLIKLTTSYNEEVAGVILENAPNNVKYTSPEVQKEILHVFAEKVRKKIVEDICDSKYCIIVDEASDENTSSSTLYSSICETLTSYELVVDNLHGQGYDGASNMHGEWKGLQALFLKDYPCAYYIHCMAHRLQLALVAAAREVSFVHEFFHNLSFIVNVVGASSKCQDELQVVQVAETAELLEYGEINIGKGANQIGTLKRAEVSRWSSHFTFISSLIRMLGRVETGKASHYYLVDRLIRLVLTLLVSTATTERAFSAMKIVKNRIRNKMDDDFIADSLVLYIEKDIAEIFSLDSILGDFNDVRECRV